MTPTTLEHINRLDRPAFVALLGEIFEHSPWVAEGAWPARPFATVTALHAAMVRAVKAAPRTQQLALLRAHPELAGKLAQAGQLTAATATQHASAGLNAHTPAEMRRIAELNAAYREKHGFPFIVAVKNYTRRGILREFERRAANDPEVEFATCLDQVCEIGLIRLEALLPGETA